MTDSDNALSEPDFQHVLREREYLEAILEAANDAFIVLDTERRVATANLQFEAFFGVARQDLYGRPIEVLVEALRQNPTMPPTLTGVFLGLAGNNAQTVGGDCEIGGDLGGSERRVLVWYSAPIHGQIGSVMGRLFVFRDATRERESERAKNLFVSVVSHELRTPLTAIIGFTDFLLDGDAGELSPTIKDYVEIIEFSADRLLHLVNDVLDVTQLETGRVDLHIGRVALAELIRAAAASLRLLAEKKEQTLELNLPADLPDSWADRERVIQIVTNLINNAIKYTPNGGKVWVDGRALKLGDTVPPGAAIDLRLPALLIGVHDTG